VRFDLHQADAIVTGVTGRIRKIEIAVLSIGSAIAVGAVLYAGRGAFQANTAWTEGMDKLVNFLLTLGALAIVAGVALLPYVCLFFLGRFIPAGSGAARVAGLVISCLTVLAERVPLFRGHARDPRSGRALDRADPVRAFPRVPAGGERRALCRGDRGGPAAQFKSRAWRLRAESGA
jgi:hypothetical protein